MRTYKVGYFVGSLSSTSINRVLSKALIRLAREDLEFRAAHRQPAVVQPGLRQRLPGGTAGVEGRDPRFGCRPVHDPGVQPLDPGSAEKTNVIDWASRPWGKHSFDHMSAAVIGASPGQIGTAVGQQSLRAVLSFCNARQMTRRRPTSASSPACSPTTVRSPTSRRRRSWPTSCRSSATTSSGTSRYFPDEDTCDAFHLGRAG